MPADWRSDTLRSLPDEKVGTRAITFKSAYGLISDAAHNRRMTVDEFIGRAALAVAVYDLEEEWLLVTKKEPPLRDIRRLGLPPKRMYGKGFGPWHIMGMTRGPLDV